MKKQENKQKKKELIKYLQNKSRRKNITFLLVRSNFDGST